MEDKNIKIKAFIVLIILLSATIIGAYLITSFTNKSYSYKIKTFSSYDELFDFLSTNHENFSNYFQYSGNAIVRDSSSSESKSSNGDSIDYSKTNVQVEGVDEPDIVKTDGKYIYVLADQKLFILEAYPAEDAQIKSKISIKDDVYVSEFFVSNNYLIVFGSSYNYPILYKTAIEEDEGTGEEKTQEEIPWEVSSSVIKIYDISSRANPILVKNIEIDGTYFDSRMIGNYVYVVSSEYSYYIFRYYNNNYTLNVPEITIDNKTSKISCNQIYYIDSPEPVDSMTHVISINLDNLNVVEKSFLIGVSENMYMSENNIYLVYTNYFFNTGAILKEYNYDEEKTIIHKINVNNGQINYIGKGVVPGRVLNQFSMDEYNNFFRIATTVGYSWDVNNPSKNNIFVLDENLNQVSSIKDIAPGEQIYSARFLGEKAYLVTFKNTDPFYTIDLSDPFNPRILGYLKIPGFSSYLHPYDENHIIGIGKETIESYNPSFAWYLGLKIALFDVSDFENPVEIDKIVIGDRGTDSPVLYDHKAFLFSKEKELLVIPVSLYEIDEETKNEFDDFPGPDYGEFTFQGAYVFKLNLDGFEYKGRITHLSEDEKQQHYRWWYWGDSSSYINRLLYIE
ncbi:MAG: beta-propeller domain-containing protein, partial [Thermoplasmatota archaeon]